MVEPITATTITTVVSLISSSSFAGSVVRGVLSYMSGQARIKHAAQEAEKEREFRLALENQKYGLPSKRVFYRTSIGSKNNGRISTNRLTCSIKDTISKNRGR